MNRPGTPITIRIRKDSSRDKSDASGEKLQSALPDASTDKAPLDEADNFAEESIPSSAFRKRPGNVWNHPILVSGLYLIAVSVLVWALAFRLGGISANVAVEARMLTNRPLPEPSTEPLTVETVESTRARVREAHGYLIQGEEGLVALVAELERLSLIHGWRAEVAVQVALDETVPMVRAKRYPLDVRLTANSAPVANSQPEFHRLIAFIDELRAMHKKLELESIRVQAGPNGIQTSDLHFIAWMQIPDEKTTAK